MTADKWTVTIQIDKQTGKVSFTSDAPTSISKLDGDVNAGMNAVMCDAIANSLSTIFPDVDMEAVAELVAYMFCQTATRHVFEMIENGSEPDEDVKYFMEVFKILSERLRANTEIGRSLIINYRIEQTLKNVASDPENGILEILSLLGFNDENSDKPGEETAEDNTGDKPESDRLWRSSK